MIEIETQNLSPLSLHEELRKAGVVTAFEYQEREGKVLLRFLEADEKDRSAVEAVVKAHKGGPSKAEKERKDRRARLKAKADKDPDFKDLLDELGLGL